MKIGDTLKFKKFKWVIVEKKISWAGVVFFKYRVYRRYDAYPKYFRFAHLSNTDSSYTIFPHRWNFLKLKLAKNPDFLPNMSLWSNKPR